MGLVGFSFSEECVLVYSTTKSRERSTNSTSSRETAGEHVEDPFNSFHSTLDSGRTKPVGLPKLRQRISNSKATSRPLYEYQGLSSSCPVVLLQESKHTIADEMEMQKNETTLL